MTTNYFENNRGFVNVPMVYSGVYREGITAFLCETRCLIKLELFSSIYRVARNLSIAISISIILGNISSYEIKSHLSP